MIRFLEKFQRIQEFFVAIFCDLTQPLCSEMTPHSIGFRNYHIGLVGPMCYMALLEFVGVEIYNIHTNTQYTRTRKQTNGDEKRL